MSLIHPDVSEKAGHTVYRYQNRWLAAFFFRYNQPIYFPSGLPPTAPVAGSEDWRLGGDSQAIQCTIPDRVTVGTLPRCTAVIRYGLLISDFSTPIGEPFMSEEQFRTLVQLVDERFRSCER